MGVAGSAPEELLEREYHEGRRSRFMVVDSVAGVRNDVFYGWRTRVNSLTVLVFIFGVGGVGCRFLSVQVCMFSFLIQATFPRARTLAACRFPVL